MKLLPQKAPRMKVSWPDDEDEDEDEDDDDDDDE